MKNFEYHPEYQMRFSDHILALIRRVFHNNPEFRHDSLKYVARYARFLGGNIDSNENLTRELKFSDGSMPLKFSCPIILAAGANKTAEDIVGYGKMGFGGITVGTATLKFREGNTHRPRIGFLEEEHAIYNSMGLNNEGIKVISQRVKDQLSDAHKAGMCVGISVAETPGLTDEKDKLSDIIETFSIAYNVADYIEINVSCPNTGEKRLDLDKDFLKKIFDAIKSYRDKQDYRKAVFAKLSPDLPRDYLKIIMDILARTNINGVVMGNTYPTKKIKNLHIPTNVSYDELIKLRKDGDRGGLSGRPLFRNMRNKVRFICQNYPEMKVIACGGIENGRQVYKLLDIGAAAVQCYSVVAFRWMAAHAMRKDLQKALLKEGFNSLSDFDSKNQKY